MNKQIYFIIMAVALIVFIFAFASLGAKGGGDLSDPSFYCRSLIEGALFGDNIEIGSVDCGEFPFPASVLDFQARLIGGDDDIRCQAKVDNNPYGEEKSIGDLGISESAYYNFKISHVPIGQHKITIRCQGISESAEKTSTFGVVS